MATRSMELRVASSTPAKSLAVSITESLKNPSTSTQLRCMGAASVNQATKAVIIANATLSTQGLKALIAPHFATDEKGKTVIVFDLKILETNG